MPLTDQEFQEACIAICPHCRAGKNLRRREDTLEFVHDGVTGNPNSHSICWANGLRQLQEKKNG